ncbi:MAG: tRNA (N6-isopentenyl adenosine(37)-C2)-methylthiotransferase MiaB [Vicingaceae bacterium]
MKSIDESKQGTATILKKSDQSFQKKVYIESYGCQMNFSDSEIVASILSKNGFETTRHLDEAELILLNTCSIRDKAEQTVRNRLSALNQLKNANSKVKIGVLGCMAERLKSNLLDEEKLVDLVVGPDAYRDLPVLIEEVENGHKSVNVILSKEETYADISPVRLNENGVTAFVTITRGCDNMCTFCVVPFTRGRERSRDTESIVKECKELFEKGYKEVTLLGQNVDSYLWYGTTGLKKFYDQLSEEEKAKSVNFAQLLEKVALISPDLRVRFSTSHPKDITDEVLYTMAKYENICNYIHLPFQSGNSRILELMNRGYNRSWYQDKIDSIKKIIPDCGLSTDIIAGFCTETEEEHQDTLSLMEYVKFDYAFMFAYSERPNTLAQRKLKDDVPLEVKKRRLSEIIDLQQKHSLYRNQSAIGKTYKVLIEGLSKKSDQYYYGRNSQNTVIVFPKLDYKVGDYVNVLVNDCTPATLKGEIVN